MSSNADRKPPESPMSQNILQAVASDALDVEATLRWLGGDLSEWEVPETPLRGITRYQFAADFLHALRHETDPLLVPATPLAPQQASSAANITHDPPVAVSAPRSRRRPARPTPPRHSHAAVTPPPRHSHAAVTPRGNCLGDYILSGKTSTGKKRGNKNASTDSIDSPDILNDGNKRDSRLNTGVTQNTPHKVLSRDTTPKCVDNNSDCKTSNLKENRSSPITPNNVSANLINTSDDVTPETSLELDENKTSKKKGLTPFSVKSFDSSRLLLSSNIGFDTPEVIKNKQTSTEKSHNKIKRVNVTLHCKESSPSVFNIEGVEEIDPSDKNQFKYNQNDSTPTNTAVAKSKITPETFKDAFNNENVTPSTKNTNPGKISENITPKTVRNSQNTSQNNSDTANVSETPKTNELKSSEMNACETPNTSTIKSSDTSTPLSECVTPWSKSTLLDRSSDLTPWSNVSARITSSAPWSCDVTPVTDTPHRVTPLTESAGDGDNCSEILSGTGPTRVGMRPRALVAAFSRPKDGPTDASEVSNKRPKDEASEVSNKRALDACSRLYAAILDHNLVDIVHQEIAYLGSLSSPCGTPSPTNCIVMTTQDAAYLSRTTVALSAVGALLSAPPLPRRAPPAAPLSVPHYDAEREGVGAFTHPHAVSAHKRQRDAFNQLYRWWRESGCMEGPRTGDGSVRTRARSILAAGRGDDNVQHLAQLVTAQLMHDTDNVQQESKLSKLRRRLTAPSTGAPSLPHEDFYRDVFTCSESVSWQSHAGAALAAALAHALDVDKRVSTEELCGRVRATSSLGRLLGAVLGPGAGGTLHPGGSAARQYSQPCVDIHSLVTECGAGRLTLSLPFLHHYLSSVPCTALRTPYHCNALRGLATLHRQLPGARHLTKPTKAYLTCIVSSTFALARFPPHLLPSQADDAAHHGANREWKFSLDSVNSVDACGVVDVSVLIECLPAVRQLVSPNVPLVTSGTVVRHVTPVTLPRDTEDHGTTRDRQLQSLMEQQLLQTSGWAARRAVDMCVERAATHGRAALQAAIPGVLRGARADTLRQLPASSPAAVFRAALSSHATRALNDVIGDVMSHASTALTAVLAHHRAALALAGVCARRARAALQQWARDAMHPDMVCPDIPREVRALLSSPPPPPAAPAEGEGEGEGDMEGVADALIQLKECVCLVLEGSPCDMSRAIQLCTRVCLGDDVSSGPRASSAWHEPMLRLAVDLCLAELCRQPEVITPSFLQSMEAIWTPLSPPQSQSTNERQDTNQTDLSTNSNTASKTQRLEPTNNELAVIESQHESTNEHRVGPQSTNQALEPSRDAIGPANEELAPTPPTSDEEDETNRVKKIVIDPAFVEKHDEQNNGVSLCRCLVSAETRAVWHGVVSPRTLAFMENASDRSQTALSLLVSHLSCTGRLPSAALQSLCLSLYHVPRCPRKALTATLRAVSNAPPQGANLIPILQHCLTDTDTHNQ